MRANPGRSPRSEYMFERANSSTVTRQAKATMSRVCWNAIARRAAWPWTRFFSSSAVKIARKTPARSSASSVTTRATRRSVDQRSRNESSGGRLARTSRPGSVTGSATLERGRRRRVAAGLGDARGSWGGKLLTSRSYPTPHCARCCGVAAADGRSCTRSLRRALRQRRRACAAGPRAAGPPATSRAARARAPMSGRRCFGSSTGSSLYTISEFDPTAAITSSREREQRELVGVADVDRLVVVRSPRARSGPGSGR